MPNRRAASGRLIPPTYTARRTCPYSSTPFIPPRSAHLGRRPSAAGFLLRRGRSIRPLYEGFFSPALSGVLLSKPFSARNTHLGHRDRVIVERTDLAALYRRTVTRVETIQVSRSINQWPVPAQIHLALEGIMRAVISNCLAVFKWIFWRLPGAFQHQKNQAENHRAMTPVCGELLISPESAIRHKQDRDIVIERERSRGLEICDPRDAHE